MNNALNSIESVGIEWSRSDRATLNRAYRAARNGAIVDVWKSGAYLGAVYTGRLEDLRCKVKVWAC